VIPRKLSADVFLKKNNLTSHGEIHAGMQMQAGVRGVMTIQLAHGVSQKEKLRNLNMQPVDVAQTEF